MAQSVAEWTGDQVAEAARQASRAATALADALEESLERRVASQNKAATLPKSSWTTQSSACSGTPSKQW